GSTDDQYKVGVIQQDKNKNIEFLHTQYIRFIPLKDQQDAITKVARHQLDMLLDTDSNHYWINETSPKGYLLERLLNSSSGNIYTREILNGRPVRYVDWLIPGVLGMNMMFSALYGVGYVIVRYRKNGVLKRLKATPLNALEFLGAQLVSRLWLILAVVTVVYFGTHVFVDFVMHGHYLHLLAVFALGAFSMICLGLVIAARLRSEELADGLLNLVSWPMMFLSGVWFSLDGLHPWVQKLAQLFPLTHVTGAARAIMLDGAGLIDVGGHLAILAVMSLIFLLLGAFLFRWE
ncbi:MAG: type transport system permease protein, partial [Pseudomonadota bacterium]|nr:type transport system permease protein [Pseudomonadota bacterium]